MVWSVFVNTSWSRQQEILLPRQKQRLPEIGEQYWFTHSRQLWNRKVKRYMIYMKKWQEGGINNDPSKASLDQYYNFTYSKRRKEYRFSSIWPKRGKYTSFVIILYVWGRIERSGKLWEQEAPKPKVRWKHH